MNTTTNIIMEIFGLSIVTIVFLWLIFLCIFTCFVKCNECICSKTRISDIHSDNSTVATDI